MAIKQAKLRQNTLLDETIEKAIQKLSWIMEKASGVENLSEIDFSDLDYISRTAYETKKLLQSTKNWA
jgi:hypothetical protein